MAGSKRPEKETKATRSYLMGPFDVVQYFELAVSKYTGAPITIATDSCTNALGIVFEYIMDRLKDEYRKDLGVTAHIPSRTYIGVPMQAKRAGMTIDFIDEEWKGEYDIGITYYNTDGVVCSLDHGVWDSARRFRKDMWYEQGKINEGRRMNIPLQYKCVSFHATKILGHTQGGAILTNDPELKQYAREMRHDGRRHDVENWQPRVLGRHDYIWPDTAAALFYKLNTLPEHNEDLPNSDYPDLSQMEIFK